MLPLPSRSNAVANRIPRITKRSVDAIKAGGTGCRLLGWRTHRLRAARAPLGPQGVCRPDPRRRKAPLVHHRRPWTGEPGSGAITCAGDTVLREEGHRPPRDAAARREAEPSMRDLGQRFLEEYVPVHCKPSTGAEYRRSVALFVNPVLGALRISEVERKDIAALHHGLRGQALSGEPDAGGAVEDVQHGGNLGLARRWVQSLPACQALQGA